jgi:CRP/FNR family transcriptional regulator, dissimilatory nitrate respiration regulator
MIVLENISLFSGILKSSLDELQHIARKNFHKKGCMLFSSREAPSVFVYLLHGWVKLSTESMNGQDIIVDILTQEHYFGEQFIFDTAHTADHAYAAHAISDTEALFFPVQVIKQLLANDHQLSLNLLQGTLCKQQELSLEVEHLAIQNAAQRIGCFLLRLCEGPSSDKITLHFPHEKGLLAARLGMRVETFSRTLSKLSELCAIEINGDEITILDQALLRAFVCQQCSLSFPSCKTGMHNTHSLPL